MDNKSYFQLLNKNRLISEIWLHILDLIAIEINDKKDKDNYLIIFAIYFSLIDDGNVAMSMNKDKLLSRWKEKIDYIEIMMQEKEEYNKEEFDDIKTISFKAIEESLKDINEANLGKIIGKSKVFSINNDYLYVPKYNIARKGIASSISRLFPEKKSNVRHNADLLLSALKDGFKLTTKQKEAVEKGLTSSLIITGGPGTGKTTSILFLLLNLLSEDKEIHLIAPSGKASSRMKESIINGVNNLKDEYKNSHKELIDKIKNLEESTIHRLLGVDHETHGFNYNKLKKFNNNSVFVIDEASMIDITLFNSLLEAMPDDAKLFIMGDKNQLPSVECGAVFADLLANPNLKPYIVELDVSVRFSSETDIYKLAEKINKGEDLDIDETCWKNYDEFKIEPQNKKIKPVFYYLDYKDGASDKIIISHILDIWGQEFYSKETLADLFTDIEIESDFDRIFSSMESSKILCAENEGTRGVKTINEYIKNHFVNKDNKTSLDTYYPGEIMMINKNNKALDLYNGDSGVLVSFKNDETLYFMLKKSSNIIVDEGKKEDRIFKLGSYLFYPLRMIAKDEIDLAYAISIHKSQGSDYENILVILPKAKGHPLLNRQIIYTAITRTKGNTYLLSNINRLNEAKDHVLKRDTNIFVE